MATKFKRSGTQKLVNFSIESNKTYIVWSKAMARTKTQKSEGGQKMEKGKKHQKDY